MNKKREKPLPAGSAARVEDRRHREYESLLAIISSSRDIIYSAGLDGKIAYASPRVSACGYTPKELLGRRCATPAAG